jgi:hypothetical protein
LTGLHVEAGTAAVLGQRKGVRRRLRWYALVLLVTILCAGAYLLGIWVGMRTQVTCTTTSPGQIVCGSGTSPAAPDGSTLPPQEQGSA